MHRRVLTGLVVLAALSVSVPISGSAAAGGSRPALTVAAPAYGCPAVEGAFVVLLDPARGMLLLSGAKFPGGRGVGKAAGGPLVVKLPRGGTWDLAKAGASETPVEVWGAAYRWRPEGGGGCVAFDRDRFSSEGDLVTYAQWLVNDVYLKLPKAERERFPALRLADRQVRLRVQPAGYGAVSVQDTEGSTMAIKLPAGSQTLLLRPFVLDETTSRVAIEVSITDKPFWERAEKRPLGFVVASPSEPATLTDPAVTIQVEPELPAPAPAGP